MNLVLFALLFFMPPTYCLGDIDSLEECGLIIVEYYEISEDLDKYLDELNELQAERLNPESHKACDSPNSER